jgi:hypothetical protein
MAAGLLICGLTSPPAPAQQGSDMLMLRDVTAVREALARSQAALRQYTWTEQTEVLIKGDVKSSTFVSCSYDLTGELQKVPMQATKPDETPSAMSKRPLNRKKADMADYVQRAVSLVHTYLPPKPELLLTAIQGGNASLSPAGPGQSEIQFKNYWKDRDLLTVTFDTQSKTLRKVGVRSYLATEKDPVTMDAVFETLPDGTNHLASTVLKGDAKKIQVTTRNSGYQKAR